MSGTRYPGTFGAWDASGEQVGHGDKARYILLAGHHQRRLGQLLQIFDGGRWSGWCGSRIALDVTDRGAWPLCPRRVARGRAVMLVVTDLPQLGKRHRVKQPRILCQNLLRTKSADIAFGRSSYRTRSVLRSEQDRQPAGISSRRWNPSTTSGRPFGHACQPQSDQCHVRR